MAYDDTKKQTHLISLTDRSNLSISGVEDVEHFDESVITLTTEQGDLIIRGENLHIKKLNLEGGELFVDGYIESLSYEEPPSHRSSFLRSLFHA